MRSANSWHFFFFLLLVLLIPKPAGAYPKRVLAVGAGSLHTCALLSTGEVKCWGYNYGGELGLGSEDNLGRLPGDMGEDLPPVNLGTGRTAKGLTVGSMHACAILDDDSVKCWGENTRGQLGTEDNTWRGANPTDMGDNLPRVNLGTGRTARTLVAGGSHTCAILDNHQTKCWGNNSYFQLGFYGASSYGIHPGDMGDQLPYLNLGRDRIARMLAAGDLHTCALLDNGSVKCWGTNYHSALGSGSYLDSDPTRMGDQLLPVDLGPGRTAKFIAAGHGNTCAILDNDELKCWGYNAYGQLGIEDPVGHIGYSPAEMGGHLRPVILDSGIHAVRVSVGEHHVCAILSNAKIKCWGLNFFGALGTETNRDFIGSLSGDMLSLKGFSLEYAIRSITSGLGHNCALLGNGGIKCWGRNDAGQLGLEDGEPRGAASGDMSTLPFVRLWD